MAIYCGFAKHKIIRYYWHRGNVSTVHTATSVLWGFRISEIKKYRQQERNSNPVWTEATEPREAIK